MMFKSKPKININTHRIIREQIERSLKSVRNKRLVQVLGAVLQISHIRKCVLSEAQIKILNISIYSHTYIHIT